MAELPAPLKKQIGPFPVVGWLGIIAAGVVFGLLLRRSSLFKSKPTPPMELDENSSGAINPATGAPWPSGVAAPSNAPPTAGAGSVNAPVAAPPPTNLEWSRRAIEWLIANGTPPTVADNAIRKYLEGMALDINEAAAIAMVLRSPIGVPPEYVPPMRTADPVSAPAPPPTPGVPTSGTTANRKMLIRPDDGDIAQFVSDGRTKEWVPDSYTAKALVASGNVAAAGTDGAGWPIPFPIPRATVNALAPIGPPPNYGGSASPVKTVW